MTDNVAQLFIDWIANNLDKKAGRTQSGLAEHMHVAHPQVTQLLKGKRDLKVREVPIIAEYLNAPPPNWPNGSSDVIRGDQAIIEMLQRIEGLDQRGVEVVFSVIDTVIQRHPSKSEPSSSDDQPESAKLHRELKS